MLSEITWKLAPAPNYKRNVDKQYPYSEEPCSKQHNLIKIPSNDLIEHVSYWGEGVTSSDDGPDGFADCYNVNHQYQLVSKGPDKNTKIPNRIPVENYEHCDTSNYIKDNSVNLVTVMGDQITKNCAEDIVRILNRNAGKVVVFGLQCNSEDLKALEDELKTKELFRCPGYDHSNALRGLSSLSRYKVYLNLGELKEQLTKFIDTGSYVNAVYLTQRLHEHDFTALILQIVLKMLQDGSKNIVSYAYQVYQSRAKDLVIKYFPRQFKLLFGQDYVKIINKKNDLALKLDANVDYYNDRLAWGDSQDKTSHRMKWELVPIWDNNEVVFKIKNVEHGMFLKLDVNGDSYGDRKCWGSNNSNEGRHKWSLEPVSIDYEVLFFIVNHHYKQGLKLDANVDWYGDRLLWGHDGRVYNHPEYFGWKVKPFYS